MENKTFRAARNWELYSKQEPLSCYSDTINDRKTDSDMSTYLTIAWCGVK